MVSKKKGETKIIIFPLEYQCEQIYKMNIISKMEIINTKPLKMIKIVKKKISVLSMLFAY